MTEYTESRIDRSDRPAYFYTYYVSGYGTFPLDMLRYDSCWPSTSVDVAKIDRSDKSRSIKLHSHQRPTPERWESFLWKIGSKELVT